MKSHFSPANLINVERCCNSQFTARFNKNGNIQVEPVCTHPFGDPLDKKWVIAYMDGKYVCRSGAFTDTRGANWTRHGQHMVDGQMSYQYDTFDEVLEIFKKSFNKVVGNETHEEKKPQIDDKITFFAGLIKDLTKIEFIPGTRTSCHLGKFVKSHYYADKEKEYFFISADCEENKCFYADVEKHHSQLYPSFLDYCQGWANSEVYSGDCPYLTKRDWVMVLDSLLPYYGDILIDGRSLANYYSEKDIRKVAEKVLGDYTSEETKPEETETKFTFTPIVKKERTKISLI